jgi:hypothetical protein
VQPSPAFAGPPIFCLSRALKRKKRPAEGYCQGRDSAVEWRTFAAVAERHHDRLDPAPPSHLSALRRRLRMPAGRRLLVL